MSRGHGPLVPSHRGNRSPGPRPAAPYHVGIGGGHDVGVDTVGLHDRPQPGEPRRGVGGRRGQVLVAQGDKGWGGDTSCSSGAGSDPTWGGVPGRVGTAGLTGGSAEQFRMSVLAKAACGSQPMAQPGDVGTPWSWGPTGPLSSPEPVLGSWGDGSGLRHPWELIVTRHLPSARPQGGAGRISPSPTRQQRPKGFPQSWGWAKHPKTPGPGGWSQGVSPPRPARLLCRTVEQEQPGCSPRPGVHGGAEGTSRTASGGSPATRVTVRSLGAFAPGGDQGGGGCAGQREQLPPL